MEKELESIDLTPAQRKEVTSLLKRHLPDTEVWAYGSRVKFTARPQSDLDIVAFTTPEQSRAMYNLKEAFEESSLPFRVDLFVWDEVPEQFHKNIKKERVVLQDILIKENGMSFSTDTLESMCDLIVDCPHSTPKWTDYGILVLRNQNIKNGVLNLSTPSFTNEEDYQKRIKRATPQAGDIVFTREAPMGEVCMIPDGLQCCLGQRQVLLRPKDSVCGDYLFWALQSPFVQHQISWNEGTGSTVSNVRIPVLKALNIPRHPGSEEFIAKVLSDIAGKAELNTQTNLTLEQIAQTIFKSWFVDFEPVKAKMTVLEAGGTTQQAELAAMHVISAKDEATLKQMKDDQPEAYAELEETAALFPSAMQKTEFGKIPVGWRYSEIGNEVTVAGGSTPPTKNSDFWENGSIHWTTPKDLSGLSDKVLLDTGRKITSLGLKKISSGLLPINTVLMSSRAPVGYLALAKVPVAVNQGYIAMKCTSVLPPEYVIQWCAYNMDNIKQRAGGTTFAEISKKNFKPISVVVPSADVLDSYKAKVEGLYDLITNYVIENDSLAEIRNSLLPKLLAGDYPLSGD